MSLSKKISICSALLILLLHSPLQADTYFFVTFRYPPLAYENDDGAPEGIFVNMISTIMARIGHGVRIEVFPWTRALHMVKSGKADGIFTAYKNEEREQFLDYPEEVLFPQAVYFYKNRKSDIQFNGDMNSLTTRRIGVVSTISYGKTFDKFKSELTLERARKLEHNFTKLLLGRIDLLPSDKIVADNVIAKMGIKEHVTLVPHQLDSIPSYIAFSKKRNLKQLIKAFDIELGQMKASGEYFKMLNTAGIHTVGE